jgi:hypothetical protein
VSAVREFNLAVIFIMYLYNISHIIIKNISTATHYNKMIKFNLIIFVTISVQKKKKDTIGLLINTVGKDVLKNNMQALIFAVM